MKKALTFLLLLCGVLTSSAQLLYRIEGKDLKAPSYLFGTHHMAPLSVIDSVGALDSFAQTEAVVGEIDMTQNMMQLAMAMQPHMMAPADSTLSKVLSAEDYALAADLFAKYAPQPGLQLQMMEPMKPMVVSSMLIVGMMSQLMPDFDATKQLDSYFQNLGSEQGKEIIALETPDYQASVLYDSTSIAEQARSLAEGVKDPEKVLDNARKLNDAYLSQNLEGLYGSSREESENPEFMVALLDRRNADWLQKLPAIMSRKPAFIAVGALHLVGDNGVIEGLRRLGYKVTPVNNK